MWAALYFQCLFPILWSFLNVCMYFEVSVVRFCSSLLVFCEYRICLPLEYILFFILSSILSSIFSSILFSHFVQFSICPRFLNSSCVQFLQEYIYFQEFFDLFCMNHKKIIYFSIKIFLYFSDNCILALLLSVLS